MDQQDKQSVSSSSINPSLYSNQQFDMSAQQQMNSIVLFDISKDINKLQSDISFLDNYPANRYHMKIDFIDWDAEHQLNELQQNIKIVQKETNDIINERKAMQKQVLGINKKKEGLEALHMALKQKYQNLTKAYKKQQQTYIQKFNKLLKISPSQNQQTKILIKQELKGRSKKAAAVNQELLKEKQRLSEANSQLIKQISELEKNTKKIKMDKKKQWLFNQMRAEKQGMNRLQSYINKYEAALKKQ